MRAVQSHDARFDGWFFSAVTTTGIYCRPSCPARAPKPANMQFFASSAAAQLAGFRACKRCRPDATPGSPEWNGRADVVARAMRLIADGTVEAEGVNGLARRLGYSARQLERHLRAEVGAGPLALARAQRAQVARQLIENTTLAMTDVSHGAGFASLRSFNDTIKEVFAVSPSQLRSATRNEKHKAAPGAITLKLPFRKPLLPDNLFGHLAATAIPGVEEWHRGRYRRVLRLPHGNAIVELQPGEDHVICRLRLADSADLTMAINRCRWLLDLDADPSTIDDHLSLDLHLGALISRAPGRRVPRTVDNEEMAIRAILGQQVSTAAARTHAARLAVTWGEPVDDPDGSLRHAFPSTAVLADLDPQSLALPITRRNTLIGLIAAINDERLVLDIGSDWHRARAQLAALKGIGPWTIETIAMRALGDPDAFLASDLGVLRAAEALGLPTKARLLDDASKAWAPWRAYAVQHMWATMDHAVNQMPPTHEEAS